MILREANIRDIKQIHLVRNSVTENTLSNPDLITEKDYIDFITQRGKGWVYEINNTIVGFSIVDLKENNVWALFIHPNYDKKGIGRQLHNIMLDWYFSKTTKNIWLGTTPNTRAETFYRKSGWLEIGTHKNDELQFEMTYEKWKSINDKTFLIK